MTIPAGFGEVRHFYIGSGAPTGAQVTYGIDDAGIIDIDDWVEQVHAAWGAAMEDHMVQNVDLIRTECKFGPDEDGPTVEFVETIGGNILTAQAPPNLCFLIRKQTALGGRRGRGRMFLPGVAEADVDQAGNVSEARQTGLNASFGTFHAALVTLDSPMVLLHDPATVWALEDGQPVRVPVGVAPAPTVVTSLSAQAVAATQRRRMRR
jgi:hypothetical protein